MRFLSSFALGVALASGAAVTMTAIAPSAYAQDKPRKVKLSKEFSKAAGPLQKQVEAGDATAKPAVMALLAQPWAGDDLDVAGQFAINLGAKTKDTELQAAGIDARLRAGMMNQADTARMQFFAGALARQDNNWAKAEPLLKSAIANGYPGAGVYLELANGYAANDNPRQSLTYLSQAIDLQKQSGQDVPEDWYRAIRDRALATGDRPLYAKWATNWAAAYPSAESWRDAVTAYRYQTRGDALQNLEVLRFMRASGALTESADYKEYAEEALRKNLFGEVVDVLEDGRLKGVIAASDPIVPEVLQPTKGKLTGDKASLPAAPANVRGSGSSSVMMNFADTWLGYEDYSKAVAFYEAGLSKPGAESDRGQMGIGIAKVFAGDLSAAKTAFAKVSGTREPLADMWLMWIDQQSSGASAAAAATAEASDS